MQKDFEEILTDFFKKHDNRQLRHNKPHKIAVLFKGREDEVMEHICKKYDVDPKTIAGMDLSSPSQPPSDPDHPESASAETSTATADEAKEEGSEEKVEEKVEEGGEEAEASPDEVSAESDEKPKSKKKLVIIILIVILLAAAGAAGYFFKDKILGIITSAKQDSPTPALPDGEGEPTLKTAKDEVEKTEEPPEAATDEQTSEEADETEKVKEEGNDEETSGEEE